MNDWVLLFSNSVHGNSLATFTRLCAGQGSTMIVVETTTGQVFGAYASSSWRTDKVRLNLPFFRLPRERKTRESPGPFCPVSKGPCNSAYVLEVYVGLESFCCARPHLESYR